MNDSTMAVSTKAEGAARGAEGTVKDAKAPEGVGSGVPSTNEDGASPASPPSDTYLLQVEFRTGTEDTGDRDFITITKATTAKELCGLLSARHDLLEADRDYMVLVMMYPTREEDGSLTRILHTLKEEEKPMEELEEVFRRKQHAVGAFTREQLLENDLIHWCFKDVRGPPLDPPGYLSGSEASEDEEEAPWNDLGQVGQGYYSGYLLKRSNRDPCLWRRRWCILGEDKVWYMKRKDQGKQSWQGKAAYISLVSNYVVEHESADVPFGIEVHTAHRNFVFRAADRPQQMLWINAIRTRIELSSENDLIRMAELMICDEELARARRLQQSVEQYWSAKGITQARLLEDGAGGGGGSSPLHVSQAAGSSEAANGPRLLRPPSRSASPAPPLPPPPLSPRVRSALFRRGGEVADGLALTMAVQEYREMCRHDRKLPNAKKWEVAQRIFDEYVRGRAKSPSNQDGAPRGPSGRRRPLFSHDVVEEIEAQLEQHAAVNRDSRVDARLAVRITRGEGMPSVSEFFGGVRRNTAVAGSLADELVTPPPTGLFDRLLAELIPPPSSDQQQDTGLKVS